MSCLSGSLVRSASTAFRYSRTLVAMPLRAKILADQSSSRQNYATMVNSAQANIDQLTKSLPNDDPDDVIFSSTYGLRVMELNRPKKLNSLNGSMARKIIARMQEWKKSDLANIIVLKGAGRALCAGGDVAELAQWNQEGKEGQQRSCDYFALEYNLDHLIASYPKPYIAYMDGITMGGGVGLSVHAPFRIATENTVFAMPETTIGFFPEVGATFFLPRMDGEMGTYLALTSEQLRGVDAFYHRIATHFIHSTSLDALSARLAELDFKDNVTSHDRYRLIAQALSEFDTGLPSPKPAITGEIRKHIDTCFAHNNPLEILAALERVQASSEDGSAVQTWAGKTISTMRERSPIGVAVTLRALRAGKHWTIAQAFRNEHAIASAFMAHPDFVTGVTARLIQRIKGRPDWAPNTLEDVRDADVDAFFARCDAKSGGLSLLETGPRANYLEYPHVWTALPSEAAILEQLQKSGGSQEEALKALLKRTDGKIGVKEKVEEVFSRL